MGVFSEQKQTMFLWLGLLVFGIFELIFAALKLNDIASSAHQQHHGHEDNIEAFENLSYIGFLFSGIMKIVASAPKLNSNRLIQLLSFIVHALVFVFSVACLIGIGGGHSDIQKGSTKAFVLQDSTLLFGSSIGWGVFYFGSWQHLKE